MAQYCHGMQKGQGFLTTACGSNFIGNFKQGKDEACDVTDGGLAGVTKFMDQHFREEREHVTVPPSRFG